MKKLRAAVIGFGGRGQNYSDYMFGHSNEYEIAAVAEPREYLLKKAEEKYGCPKENLFHDWREMLDCGVIADVLFVCTNDNDHVEPAIEAIKTGYKYLMVEKPIDKDISKCNELVRVANEYGATVQVCHSLRYTRFFRTLKDKLEEGAVGDILCINHIEGVGVFHMSHSYVRGDWGRDDSSPMLLAKCCHDTDLLLWLTGKHCRAVSSFGSLTHFTPENAPEGAPDRCIDGCPHGDTCPFNAMTYFHDKGWQFLAVEKEGFTDVEDAMRHGRYGRCAYKCDNNVVDHQTVNMEFEGGATATLTMCGLSDCGRQTHIMGTKGEIYADFYKNSIVICDFTNGNKTEIYVSHEASGHGGADTLLVADFLRVARGEKAPDTPVEISVESHAIAMAAEESRLSGKNIILR